jgi:septal ring factor EnvC (AmiA/AmiB activator)
MAQPPEFQAAPPWLGWFQLGLSSMLAVLFLVMLAWSREQGRDLRQLRMRVETLESSSSLEKAADQNAQLRTLTQRFEELEARATERLERSEAERVRLQQLLVEMRDRPGSPGQQPREASSTADPRPTRMATPGATVLRPTPPPPIPTEP